jgi:hypothetical protein
MARFDLDKENPASVVDTQPILKPHPRARAGEIRVLCYLYRKETSIG